jgi:hypothetical protein
LLKLPLRLKKRSHPFAGVAHHPEILAGRKSGKTWPPEVPAGIG